jgi:hypothetical protein
MTDIPQPNENRFMIVSSRTRVHLVIEVLRKASHKPHYVLVQLADQSVAIFTPEEFVTEWEQYQRDHPETSSPLIDDVPLFTAPRVFQPVWLKRLEEKDEQDATDVEDGLPSGIAVGQTMRSPFIRVQSKGRQHVYQRIPGNKVRKRLAAVPKEKLVELLNKSHQAGAMQFFEGKGDLGLGLKTKRFRIKHANCPACGYTNVPVKTGQDKVLLIAENLAQPREVTIADVTTKSAITFNKPLRFERMFSVIPEIAPDIPGSAVEGVISIGARGVGIGPEPDVGEDNPKMSPELASELAPEVLAEVSREREPPAQPAEKRWINVEIEGDTTELLLDHVYTLVFDVDTTVRAASVARDIEFKYEFKADETDVELEIHLSSQDFRIYDDRQKLFVPRTGKSENKARFDIKPLHDRAGTLKALILKDNNFIQELTLTIDAGKLQVISKGRPAEAATVVNPRDVHLNISYDNGAFALRFISGVTATARIVRSPQEIEDLAQQVREVWNKLVAKQSDKKLVYQVGVDIPESVNQEALKKLAQAGARLFRNVFFENQDKQTQAIGKLIRNLARDEPLKIQITSDKFFLPWGVLYVGEDIDHPDPDMFLGLKHIIELIPTQNDIKDFRLQIDGKPKFSVSLNLDKRIDKQAADKGIKAVVATQEEFWERLKTSGCVEPKVRGESTALLDVVQQHAMDERLIYFYCHASARMGDSKTHLKPSITLGDGKQLTIDDLGDKEGAEPMSLPSAPLLFLNACDSAEFSPFFYDDFLNFFVSRGARGAIGTECKIPAVFASEWANRFFTHFLPGKSLGKLFLDLRREFYDEHHNLLGLAYALYCDADTQISPGLTLNKSGNSN